MTQIPTGPKDLYCPLWRKAMAKVCHTCPWWQRVRGTDPNSTAANPEVVDRWNCAIAWGPMLSVGIAKEAHHGAAETSAFRSEVAKNNAQQASNMDALNSNLVKMHGQNTQLALAQIRAGMARDDVDALPNGRHGHALLGREGRNG
jgi:hypothetical protein